MSKRFNVYCDESCHLEHDGINDMVIGAVWCEQQSVKRINRDIRDLKEKYGIASSAELKWTKVAPVKKDVYIDLINYFFEHPALHFRCILIPDKNNLDHVRFQQTHDEWYYKMYFDMLKGIFSPEDTYEIYIDIKDTHSQVMQLVDVLIGAITYQNRNFPAQHKKSKTKLDLIDQIKEKSGYTLTKTTLLGEDKFNIFVWQAR